MSAPGELPRGRGTRAAVLAAALDVCLVLAFVLIGRASHHDGGRPAGFARTAWPFLAGLAAGWLATRAWRRPVALLPAGAGIWLCTVAAGMALRAATGQGVAVAFVGVALAFLGVFLLGWRTLAKREVLSPTRSRSGR
ncbi:MAG TPA: DUF3054 domain-containing protein [Streptosporangiaceae bacterium]|nr:DUF3054 domain-containing protein [Streptosporangiaceae bacterium]